MEVHEKEVSEVAECSIHSPVSPEEWTLCEECAEKVRQAEQEWDEALERNGGNAFRAFRDPRWLADFPEALEKEVN